MKTLVSIITAAAFALGASGSFAQSSDASSTGTQRSTGKEAMEAQMELQKNKPSKNVDKTAKAAGPRPDASKMTPEERAAFRGDVVKEAKP